VSKYTVRPIKGRHDYLVGSLPNRGKQIAGVMIHATRGGSLNPTHDDGPGTENWALHPENKGAYWDELIFRKDGTRVISTNWDTEFPKWTAGYGSGGTWAASDYYIQIEVSQSHIDQPYHENSIDSLAESVAEKSVKYDFPIVRIPYLEQMGVPPRGICTHEDSANGRKLGKSDPGPKFPWGSFLWRTQVYRDKMLGANNVTEERVKELIEAAFRQHLSDGNLITAANFLTYLDLAFDEGNPNGFTDSEGKPLTLPPPAVFAFVDQLSLDNASDVVAEHCDG